MKYFDHDTDAATDSKVMALRIFHGGAAVDCYYAIIESVYREERPLPTDDFALAGLAQKLNATMNQVTEWIDGMLDIGLLEKSKKGITSERIEDRISAYKNRCAAARKNGAKGGKAKARNAKTKAQSAYQKECSVATAKRPLSNGLANKREYKESSNKDSLYISNGNAEQSSAQHYLADDGGNCATEGAAAASDEDISAELDELMAELRGMPC